MYPVLGSKMNFDFDFVVGLCVCYDVAHAATFVANTLFFVAMQHTCLYVRQKSLRVLIILILSVQYGLKLHQVRIITAFLNGNLEEEVDSTKGFCETRRGASCLQTEQE